MTTPPLEKSARLCEEAPRDWVRASLRELLPLSYGKGLTAASRRTGEVPVYGSSGIVGWHDQALTSGPTVVVGRKGTAGAAFFSPGPCYPIDTVYFSEPVHVDGRLFTYLLNYLELGKLDQSTTIPSLSRERYDPIVVPVPGSNHQRRIAEKIDELFSQVEAGEQALERAQKLLERYRQSVLNAAVTGALTHDWREQHKGELERGEALLKRILQSRREAWEKAEFSKMHGRGKPPTDDRWKQRYKEPAPPDTTHLPDLPEGWTWANLDQLAWHSGYGTSEKSIAEQKGPLVLRIPNVRASTLVLDDLKYAQNDLGLGAPDTIAPGDMLVIRTNGSLDLLGHAVVVDSPMPAATYYASYLIRFRLVPMMSLWRWVTVVWRSELVRRAITKQAATSAGQYNISQTKLASIAIPIPPLQELAAATELAESMTEAASRSERETSAEARRASRLRQSILSWAFSGNLVSQDPADEPASVLLERIQEQRAAASQDASRRRSGRPSKGEPAMVKTRKDIKPTHLRDIIHASNGGMAPEMLWKASKLDIDDFYKQLRDEMAAGHLREERRGHTSRIVCR